MADTYLDSSVLGFDHQDRLDLQIDTYKNFAPILSLAEDRDFTKRKIDSTLTNISFGEPSNVSAKIDKIDIGAALVSDDPVIKQYAIQAIEKETMKNSKIALGIGGGLEFNLDDEAKRWINKEYGYNPLRDNEQFYFDKKYKDKSTLRLIAEQIPTFAARNLINISNTILDTFTKLGVLTYNMVQEPINSLITGEDTTIWADVADNWFSRGIEFGRNEIFEHLLPSYKEAGFDEKGFFAKLSSPHFWNTSVSDMIGFVGSMVAPAAIASKVGLLGAGKGLFGTASTLARGATNATKFLTGANTFGEAGVTLFNTAVEASFEAVDAFETSRRDLQEKVKSGELTLTPEEIDSISGTKAANTFKWNGLLLTLSNAWEMKNIIKPLLGRAGAAKSEFKDVIIDRLGSATLKETSKNLINRIGKRVAFYGPKAITGTLVEGYWEENLQTAIQRAQAGSYTRIGDDGREVVKTRNGIAGILDQYVKQTIDASTLFGGRGDIEVSESIGLGGLMGIAGGTLGSKFGSRYNAMTKQNSWYLGERRAKEKIQEKAVLDIVNAHSNFLSVQDSLDEQGNVDKEKLRTKVLALKEFDEQQDLINELDKGEAMDKEQLQVLQNSLLTRYALALNKAGVLDQAVSRFQDMAKNSEIKDTVDNANGTASYLSELGGIYQSIQKVAKARRAPRGVEEDVFNSYNTFSSDMAFKLKTQELETRPYVQSLEEQVNQASASLTEIISTDLSLAPVDESLKNSRALEYMEHYARKEVYEKLLNGADKNYIKDFYKWKLDEVNKQISALDEFLGDSKPTKGEDGNLNFFSDDIQVDKGAINHILNIFKDNYTTLNNVKVLRELNEFIADNFMDPDTGIEFTKTYLAEMIQDSISTNLISATEAKDTELQDEINKLKNDEKPPAPTGENAPIGENVTQVSETPPVTNTPTGANTPPVTNTPIEGNAPVTGNEPVVVDTDNKGNTPADTVVETTGTNIITDVTEAEKNVPSETPDPNKPVTWHSIMVASKNDTVDVNPYTEQLKNIPYDIMRAELIEMVMTDPAFAKNYNMFIVKDTFTEVYRQPANFTNAEDFVPQGEVIIIEAKDGTRPTVKDFFPNKYKDMADLPIVFSFPKKLPSLVNSMSIAYEKKKGSSRGEAMSHYNEELTILNNARASLTDTNDKIPIEFIATTEGIIPRTTVDKVNKRFGDNYKVSVKTNDSGGYKSGSVIVSFGKVSFQVGTATLEYSVSDMLNIKKILDSEFESKEAAENVRNQYLNRLVYTTKENFFSIENVDNVWKIVYRVINDKGEITNANNNINKLRFNVDNKGLTDGIYIYNATTKEMTNIDAEEYTTFIKDKLVTSFKKILDAEGNLYMKPVQQSFSFKVLDTRVNESSKKVNHNLNYNNIVAKIKSYKEKGLLTNEKIDEIARGLGDMLRKDQITTEQHKILSKALDKNRTTVDNSAKKTEGEADQQKENTQPVNKTEGKEAQPKAEVVEPVVLNTASLSKEEKAAAVKKAKAERAGAKTVDITQILAQPNSPAPVNDYTITVGNTEYKFDQKRGNLKKVIKMGTKTRELQLTKSSKEFITVIEEGAKKFPFVKHSDGTVSGFAKVELEGTEKNYTVYGLPTSTGDEVFVDSSGTPIVSFDEQQMEISAEAEVRKNLTEEGKSRLDQFLNRTC